MADPAVVLANARQTLAKTCDALTSRSTYFPIFDESKGAVDYERWRSDLITFLASAGVDFTAAFTFGGAITANITYDVNNVNDDTINGVVTYTMPQMRQLAILSIIRATLSPSGESVKLIRDCRHAGGTITLNHVTIDKQGSFLIAAGARPLRAPWIRVWRRFLFIL